MRDGLTNIQVKQGYGAYYYQGNVAWQTAPIEVTGYDSCTFFITAGAIVDADATFTVLMQESDDNTTYTDVADADMISQTPGTAPETAASFQFDDDWEVRSVGYIGSKKYAKVYITGANNTGVVTAGVIAVLGMAAPGAKQITKGAS